MKKRIFIMILAFAILIGASTAVSYVCKDVTYPIIVNGTAMTFTDAPPVNYDGRTLLPMRALSEALGVPIEWDGVKRQVTVDTIDVEELKDSCVMVYTGSNGQYTGQASGVLIDYDEILTCYHAVDGDTIYTAYYDDSAAGESCTLADTSEAEDAAVLTPPNRTIKPVKIGDSDDVKVGDKVYVISSPKGGKNVVTSGTVTGDGTFDGVYVFVSTAVTKGGSSGGAVFNSNGELIGVIDGGPSDDSLSYIIPINNIRKSLAE